MVREVSIARSRFEFLRFRILVSSISRNGKKRVFLPQHRGNERWRVNGARRWGASTVGLQSFIESTLFTVGAKVSRSGNKVRRSWRGNSVVQGGNSSRTRPNTRSNQFASPETMSSPLLSEPIELTAPGLISGIDAVQSSSSCSPVVPGSFILSPLSLSLYFFSSRDFYSKFNWIEIFYEERGRKKFRKIRKYFLSKTSKSG